jgi:hypothetical protein
MNERLARGYGLSASYPPRWEAQFKLAKFCMRASIAISDLGVFLVEPVLARSKALNDAGIPFQEDAPT